MKKVVLCCLAPPVVACRVPCQSTCAAPVSVIWLAAVSAIILGLFGGPTGHAATSWPTVGFGALLWLFASVWAYRSSRAADECAPPRIDGT
jgi:hypothetical protein